MAPNVGPWNLQFSIEPSGGFVLIICTVPCESNSRTNANLTGENATGRTKAGLVISCVSRPVSSLG
ncbi:hypothetical protein DPMN_183200 [Dreissena polymorpha]|uniref:Uncharacterized protein n=1 Tax=Dreissena polymorpha TaxID=45954 RepID=A0A9D4I5A5_DREPO|nr:hypothetical protein DPMN_183200 [Dreissena polymorpha]